MAEFMYKIRCSSGSDEVLPIDSCPSDWPESMPQAHAATTDHRISTQKLVATVRTWPRWGAKSFRVKATRLSEADSDLMPRRPEMVSQSMDFEEVRRAASRLHFEI